MSGENSSTKKKRESEIGCNSTTDKRPRSRVRTVPERASPRQAPVSKHGNIPLKKNEFIPRRGRSILADSSCKRKHKTDIFVNISLTPEGTKRITSIVHFIQFTSNNHCRVPPCVWRRKYPFALVFNAQDRMNHRRGRGGGLEKMGGHLYQTPPHLWCLVLLFRRYWRTCTMCTMVGFNTNKNTHTRHK